MKTPALWLAGLLGWQSVVSLQADVVISEFMASNSTTLADEDGEYSDWIEIANTGVVSVDLNGWYLTDDSNHDVGDPESVWVFPARTLTAGERLVVFASGKDRTPAGTGELHTNFQLDAGGEYLALIEPDGTTVATGFSPEYPKQETDISYGTGQVTLTTVDFVSEGAGAAILVPADGLVTDWKGGSEPFDDSGWISGNTGVGFDEGSGPTGFTLLDNFDSLDAGGLNGQEGWSADAGAVVGIDPADVENQVMVQAGGNIRAWKSISVPNDTTSTLFFRMRRDGEVNISAGGSDAGSPDAFGDFEVQMNNQNNAGMKVRDAAAFDDVDTFADGTWYSIWMVIDNTSDTYEVYMQGGALTEQTQVDGDTDGQTVFGFRNGAASNALVNFYARTGGTSPGVWSLDDIYLASGENLGNPAGGQSLDSFINPAGDIEAEMAGVSGSAYLRIPFETGVLPGFASLTLRMRYDDGFTAYLNGTKIASRNAPASPVWNSVATVEHPTQDVISFESIDVTAFAGLLVPESTNVLAIQGLNVSPADGDFLITPELSGVESNAAPQLLYFTAPTPGVTNGGGVFGFVGDTQFSADRGFYDAPVDVVISSSTPDATIIYTTDGSTPTENNGTAVPAPATVNISTTTPLRAAAFKSGYLPTNVDTHTYIFVADVINQGNSPAGYPSTWKGDGGSGSFPADYEMDPEVTGSAAYSDVIDDALLAVPTISLVTEKEHFFDPATGIYQNPQQHGGNWERPVSFEIIQPDGTTESIQVDAGIRIQGGHTRLPSKNPKHSFRVSFKREYGPAKLKYELFPDARDAAREFDQLVLRGAGNQSWLHHNTFGAGGDRERAQYIRDQWAKDAQLALGHPGAHSLYAHVYINGLYWGLYNPTERGSAGFGESYLGGDKEDYNALNSGQAIDGAGAAADYSALFALANGGLADSASYTQIKQILDVEALADYMIIQQYGGNRDWDHHNWYALRNSNGGKWYFLCWDSEYIFIDPNDNVVSENNANAPSQLFQRLMGNPEFRILFADRVQTHFFNGGLLTPDSVMAMWDKRKDQMFDAIVGESARWGDYRRDVHSRGGPTPIPVYDRDEEWAAERTRLFTNYFPVRSANLIAQYRAAGYFPNVDAPVFSQHGGRVVTNYPLEITSVAGGDIYYTTDGSDPRKAAEVNETEWIAEGAAMRVFVPASDALGATWRGGSEPFDDSAWLAGTAAGYETTAADYAGLYDIDLQTQMYNGVPSCYVRMTFEIPDQSALDAIASLTLKVRYDDGFAAFLNGTDLVDANAPAVLTWNATGDNHTDALAAVYQPFNVSATGIPALQVGTNVLAIHAFNQDATSSDFLIDAVLSSGDASGSGISPGAVLYAGAVTVDQPMDVRARVLNGAEWSPLTEATFYTGIPADSGNLVISEIMYNPSGPDDGEFVELMNIGSETIDLSGVRFTEGIDYTFPLNTMLAAGELVVIGRADFENSTALANDGEQLVLAAQDGSEIRSFTYNDNSPWPEVADGAGFSLILIQPEANPDHSLPENWRASSETGGNPGTGDAVPFTGIATADDDGDGASAFLEYALGTSDSVSGDTAAALGLDGLTLTVRKSSVADDALVTLEKSTDLILWEPAGDSVTLMDEVSSGSGKVESTYQVGDGSDALYIRLKAEVR